MSIHNGDTITSILLNVSNELPITTTTTTSINLKSAHVVASTINTESELLPVLKVHNLKMSLTFRLGLGPLKIDFLKHAYLPFIF